MAKGFFAKLKTGPLAPFFVVCLILLMTGCGTAEQQYQFDGPTMGTTYHVTVISESIPDDLAEQIQAVLDDVNEKMSTYDANSELMRLNNAPVGSMTAVSNELMSVLVLAQEIYRATNGAFDPSVGPLVNLWGFGPDYTRDEVPEADAVQQKRSLLGFDTLLLDANALTVSRHKDISLDLSAIAKGYGADRVGALLQRQGITHYMVEVGGELALSGHNSQGVNWHIAIEKPSPGERAVQVVGIFTDVGVATSGDYRNYFEKEGKRYSHTIDPRTGYPISHALASVTVVADSSARADALATAFMVMGTREALDFAERHGIAIMTISKTADGFQTSHSTAFSPYLKEVQ